VHKDDRKTSKIALSHLLQACLMILFNTEIRIYKNLTEKEDEFDVQAIIYKLTVLQCSA
jgi:predicted DNA-binding transcriptional regulator